MGSIFFAGLALLFIYLKLTNQIKWRWLWALAPIWIPGAILAAEICVILIFVILVNLGLANG